jgi:hypothetical protein
LTSGTATARGVEWAWTTLRVSALTRTVAATGAGIGRPSVEPKAEPEYAPRIAFAVGRGLRPFVDASRRAEISKLSATRSLTSAENRRGFMRLTV